MKGTQDLGALIGRILLVVIFVMSGFQKLTGPGGAAGYMSGAGIPEALVKPGLYLSIFAELICGLLIVIGFQTRLAALVIFLWFIPVTLIFHFLPSLHQTGEVAMTNMIMYLKNLSIMGGLLLVASMGPGAYSVDGAVRAS